MRLTIFATILLCASPLHGQDDALVRPYPPEQCPSCAEWNAPQPPVHLFGNTYYVGTRGLGSVLITSDEGHVLIDGGLPNSAPQILANIRALGFDPSDVKLILNSHAHYDHAGGIAALVRATGAQTAASKASALVIERGTPGPDDPQYGIALPMPPVQRVTVLDDGQTVRVGPIALVAHITGGHTPGGTTWSWRSCAGERCLDFVYADSQTPVSADDFRFSDSKTYPAAVADFRRGFAMLEQIACDVLITPHPGASALWERLAKSKAGLIDAGACKRYAVNARQQLERRLQQEAARSPDDLGGAINTALRHVLRRDSIFCAARSCDPVAVVVSRADSAALPAGAMPRLLPVTGASLKDVGPVLRAVTVSTEASGDVLVVRIDDLSERAPPAGLTPAIPIGGSRFYRAGHGWSIGVTRKAGAWVVTSVTEWIT